MDSGTGHGQPGLTEVAAQEFAARGAEVDRLDLDRALNTPIPTVAHLREISQLFQGRDLIVYITDAVTIADGGGPMLRQVSAWAETACTPVIVLASQCRISTRELRTLGIEAGYEAATREDVRRVAQTFLLGT